MSKVRVSLILSDQAAQKIIDDWDNFVETCRRLGIVVTEKPIVLQTEVLCCCGKPASVDHEGRYWCSLCWLEAHP